MSKTPLSPFESYVIEKAGTEPPFSGLYTDHIAQGTYHCKKCGQALYRSQDKFPSHCGWPSFDDEIQGAVLHRPDGDGQRQEIVCSQCLGHLGHVFRGELMTPKNLRHCVNSVSLQFQALSAMPRQTVVLASGCFWGTQYFLARLPGVIETRVGYCGAQGEKPSYEQVCTGKSGFLEAVEVSFQPDKLALRRVYELFFETHDFTQKDGQGPDIGPQYRSAIFYNNEEEKQLAARMLQELQAMGYEPATLLIPAFPFWPAEDFHQDYYERKGDTPYCHRYRPLFSARKR